MECNTLNLLVLTVVQTMNEYECGCKDQDDRKGTDPPGLIEKIFPEKGMLYGQYGTDFVKQQKYNQYSVEFGQE
ncbi:hypothetical protein KDW_39550 [Dictyobacter vulcani]|uniref:Uncharacterized protein n=1 Tax=Dictyobacter vulcani TaxID=2607529 RepID=A0A5J4KQB8_9CHLR|nr:hypothetical protein KDW_39550 [Dictyobacter vulcani]